MNSQTRIRMKGIVCVPNEYHKKILIHFTASQNHLTFKIIESNDSPCSASGSYGLISDTQT